MDQMSDQNRVAPLKPTEISLRDLKLHLLLFLEILLTI